MLHRFVPHSCLCCFLVPVTYGVGIECIGIRDSAHFIVMDQVILSSPVLNEGELELLLKDPLLKPQVLPTFFDIRKGLDGSLERTLDRLCEAADEAVRNGSHLLVLSDRSDELVRTI